MRGCVCFPLSSPFARMLPMQICHSQNDPSSAPSLCSRLRFLGLHSLSIFFSRRLVHLRKDICCSQRSTFTSSECPMLPSSPPQMRSTWRRHGPQAQPVAKQRGARLQDRRPAYRVRDHRTAPLGGIAPFSLVCSLAFAGTDITHAVHTTLLYRHARRQQSVITRITISTSNGDTPDYADNPCDLFCTHEQCAGTHICHAT